MANSQISLDGPPPAPPGRPVRAETPMAPMLSAPGMGANTGPGAIAERMMEVERALDSLAELLPDAAPVLAQQRDSLRQLVGAALQKGPAGASPVMGAGGLGQLMGMMQQPPGAGGPPMV